MDSPWKTVATATSNDGHPVEMRYGQFGKGRSAVEKYEFLRDGVKVGYASTYGDALTNWSRVRLGLVCDAESGRWLPATPEN